MLTVMEQYKIEVGKVICFKSYDLFSKKYIGEIILLNKETGYLTIKTLKNKFKTVYIGNFEILYCDNYKNLKLK